MAEQLRCVEPFSYDDKNGTPVTVAAGQVRASNHPDVKGHEALFEPVEKASERQGAGASYAAERATDAPGERRVLTGPGLPGR